MESKIVLQDIEKAYGKDAPVIENLNLEIEDGSFTVLLGPSGCGKSTILNIISGLLEPTQGSVDTHGKKIGYMFQKDHLFEWRTIYSNVLLGLEIQKKNTAKARETVDHLLTDYGLDKFKDSRPSQLSGGMRQRAALIRTLALEPDLLLLDEPFSALDYQTRLSVADDIGKIIRREEKTAILVTHDISEAISMADRILILSKRPASVQKEIRIHLSVENRTPFSSRSAPEFKLYFNEIWKELNHYGC